MRYEQATLRTRSRVAPRRRVVKRAKSSVSVEDLDDVMAISRAGGDEGESEGGGSAEGVGRVWCRRVSFLLVLRA